MKSSPKALDIYRTESGLHMAVRYRKEWLSIGPRGAKGYAVVHVDGHDAEDAADTWGRHICAAVNACAGLTTETLEQGTIRDLLEALQAASDWIDAQLFERRTEIQAKVRAALAKAKGGRP